MSFKKNLLFSGAILLFQTMSFSQSTISTLAKPSQPTISNNAVIEDKPVQTQEEKNTQALSKTVQGQNNLRIGLPVTADQEEYRIAKEKLKDENPEKYNEIFSQQNRGSKSSVREVKRIDYNNMSIEQKARIDGNPELFIIIE